MLGFEKFGARGAKSASPEASKEMIRPKNTDEDALELLRTKVVEEADGVEGLRPDDVDMVTNYLAIKQEETGAPYTTDSIESFEEGLDGEIFQAIQDRLAARGGASVRIEDAQGVVASAPDLAEAVHRIEEERRAD